MPTIEGTLPIRLVSPNVLEHWSKRYKRNQMHYLLIKQNLIKGAGVIQLPCRIELERQGKRLFDSDNLVSSMKGIKDSLASIILGKKRGVDDDNPGIEWVYKQIKGDYALRIEITWGDEWEKTT